jgi:hypothetical protein
VAAEVTASANVLVENLGATVLAIGALGTAAFGIVDGFKLIPWIDQAGFEHLFSAGRVGGSSPWKSKRLQSNLDPLFPALKLAYGDDVMRLLKTQYRAARSKGDLPRTLRQGVRIGFSLMTDKQITEVAVGLGLPAASAKLAGSTVARLSTVRPPAKGEAPAAAPEPAPTDAERAAMARLETAIDARIDAALVLAEVKYVTQTKVLALFVSLAIAGLVGYLLDQNLVTILVVGLTAVPLAPIAKDVATALQSAVTALKK